MALPREASIVILTGAGISAESGLRTFRDADGLWENHRVEDVATPAGEGECECTIAEMDGFGDLTLKFDTRELVRALGAVSPGEVRVLRVIAANDVGTAVNPLPESLDHRLGAQLHRLDLHQRDGIDPLRIVDFGFRIGEGAPP